MVEYLFIIVFVINLGCIAGSILVSYQLSRNYNAEFLNNYFYYLIAFLAFGFYALWGQVIIRYLMLDLNMSQGTVEKLRYIVSVLGFPFLLVAWLMQIKMAYSIRERQMPSVYILLFFMLFLIGLFTVYVLIRFTDYINGHIWDHGTLVVPLFIMMEFIFLILFIMVSIKSISQISMIRKKRLFRAFLGFFTVYWILRYTLVPFIEIHFVIMAVFLLLFFAGCLIPIIFINRIADELFPQVSLETTGSLDLNSFCSRYGISRRETQIIEQICQGKTNKEIADALFISLQTVKDHTHRIYTKIGINSRMQLLQRVIAGK